MSSAVNVAHDHQAFRLPERENPYFVKHVAQRVIDGCRSDVLLDFGDCFLQIHVDDNDDTLSAQFVDSTTFADNLFEGGATWAELVECGEWVGKSCDLTWLAVNSQGYCDSFLIAFDGIVPQVMLHGIASSIELFRIQQFETDRKVN